MSFSFKDRPQNRNGYGEQPFMFVDPEAHRMIGQITSMDLIENGEKAAREYWQKKQFANLVNHAYVQSEFWRAADSRRARTPGSLAKLSDPDAQGDYGAGAKGRLAVRRQKTTKRRDLRDDGIDRHAVENLHFPRRTVYYNEVSPLAQYFFDGLPFDENCVKIAPVTHAEQLLKQTVGSRQHRAGLGGSVGQDLSKRLEQDVAVQQRC